MFRYYLTQRPAAPGAVPSGAVNVHSYGANGAEFEALRGHRVWGYVEYERELAPAEVDSYELTPGPCPVYYPINEDMARRAHEMMSFRDYHLGSKTYEYTRLVEMPLYSRPGRRPVSMPCTMRRSTGCWIPSPAGWLTTSTMGAGSGVCAPP